MLKVGDGLDTMKKTHKKSCSFQSTTAATNYPPAAFYGGGT